MGPCTFLVTAKVTGGATGMSTTQRITDTWAKQGLKGFYPGGTAIAFRQATNWASRQGFTEGIRARMQSEPGAKLSRSQEVTAGILGGALSCWNHPFEARCLRCTPPSAARPALPPLLPWRPPQEARQRSGGGGGVPSLRPKRGRHQLHERARL